MSDAEDEIARGAAKLHDREAAAATAAHNAKEAARLGPTELMVRAAVLQRTLGPPLKDRWVALIAMLGFFGLGLALVPFRKHISFPIVLAASAVAMTIMVGVSVLIPALFAKARLARLDRIGHRVDVAQYRQLMSLNRRYGRLVLVLHFADAIDAANRMQFADALRGWLPELESAEWDGDALKATSGQLEGRVSLFSKYGSDRKFTNQAFHAIVMHAVHAALPKLDAVARVERLDVQIAGDIEKWDEVA